MANLIQIKRSAANPTVPTLANGELAFTNAGNILYIGKPNGTGNLRIGGEQVPGTLTANQALVANSTGFIDAVKTANLTTRSITANGISSPGAGYLLSVDAGGNTYWLPQSSVSINTAANFTWTGTHAFNANASFGDTFSVNGTLSANSTQLAVEKTANFNSNVSFGSDATDVVTFNSTIGSDFIPSSGSLYGLGNSSVRWTSVYGDLISAGAGGVTANSTQFVIGTGVALVANGSVGTANQVLRTNGSTVYWDTDAGDITGITAGSGLTGGGTVGALTLNVGAANGINVEADAVGVVTGSTLTVNTTGIHVNSALSITDLTLAGNLTVSGTLTTIDTNNLTVEDPLLKLANGNATDSWDIGYYGVYNSTGTKYMGMFRDATDGLFKLFSGLTVEPSTTVDTANASYTVATLQAYLQSGALTTSSSAVNITANSTVAVAITANSVTLSTPLAVTSGGIGKASVTAQALLVGNNSGAMTELTLGTDGKILQSNGSAVVYADLDGGTF